MASWKENKIVGIVALGFFVVVLVITILSMAKRKNEQRKVLLKDNPPAIIE